MSKSKHEFSLTSRQKAILEHLSRRSTSPQRLVKRAEIILLQGGLRSGKQPGNRV